MTSTYADPKVVLIEGRRRLRECGPTIATIMRFVGVSTVALAGALDMKRTTLHARLAGTSSFEQPEIDAIAIVLGVPAGLLVGPAPDAIRYLLDNELPPDGAPGLRPMALSDRRSRSRNRWTVIRPLPVPDRVTEEVAA